MKNCLFFKRGSMHGTLKKLRQSFAKYMRQTKKCDDILNDSPLPPVTML